MLVGVTAEERVGVDDIALGQPGQGGDAHGLTGADDDLVEPALTGRDDEGGHVDPAETGQRGDGLEAAGAVVVARHHQDVAAVGGQVEQGLVDEPLGLGRGGGHVEQVAGHDDQIDVPLGGQAGDLAQHGPVLVEPGPAPHQPADVPVAGVQQPHRPTSLPAPP